MKIGAGMTGRVKYYSNGQKNPILLTLSNSSDLSDHFCHGMGSIFLEKGSGRPDDCFSEDGGRVWDGGH